MKKKERRKKVVDGTAKDIIRRMLVLEPDDRFALLEEYGQLIYCSYPELDLDWIKKLRSVKR